MAAVDDEIRVWETTVDCVFCGELWDVEVLHRLAAERKASVGSFRRAYCDLLDEFRMRGCFAFGGDDCRGECPVADQRLVTRYELIARLVEMQS